MKIAFLTSLLTALTIIAFGQKIIENPQVDISNRSDVSIKRVELTDTATILTVNAKLPVGSSVVVNKNDYLQIPGDTTKLMAIKCLDYDFWESVPVTSSEGVTYRTVFPALDSEVVKFDYLDPHPRGWKFFGIRLKEIPESSMVPTELTGNWFSGENGSWTFSLFDSTAIFNNQAWKIISAKSTDSSVEIHLKNEVKEQILFCQPVDKQTCRMRTEGSGLSDYSKNPELLEKISDGDGFNRPLVNKANVIYKGFIKGFTPRLGSQTGLIRFRNQLNDQMESHIIKIDKNGLFSTEFPLLYPQEISVQLPTGTERIFLEPGTELFHLSNPGLTEQPSLLMGKSAAINYGLRATRNIAAGTMDFMRGIGEMNPEEYIDYVLSTRKEEAEKLETIQKEKNINPIALQIRKMDIDFRAAQNALRYHANKRMARFYAQRNNPDKEPKQNPGSQEFDVDLLQRIDELPVNSDLALCSPEYFRFIQSLYYTDIKRPHTAYFYRLSAFGDYLKENGENLTGEEKDMLQYINMNLVNEYDEEKSRNFNQSYREVVQKFIEKHQNEFLEVSSQFYREYLKRNLQAFGLVPEGLLVEIFEVKNYLSGLERTEEKIDEAEYNQVKDRIETDYLKELVMSAYYKKKAELEVSKSEDGPELKTEGDKLFDSMIRKLRGKVVYVDFWATWCAPCRAGIERIKPLKAELKDKDIAFVYITNNTSPDKIYKEMIPGIEGEHFKVTADEWNYLTQKFNIYGIPHYALVDKKGNVVNSHMMHMGNEKLKEVLLEQVK